MSDSLPQPTLPTNHISIINKKCTVDVDNIMNEDCEFVLFELPKDFDKSLLKKMKIKKLKKDGNKISLVNNYKGICFDSTNPISKQSLIMVNDNKKEKIILKPVDRYIKVFEAFDIAAPIEDSIMKRPLKLKQEKKKSKKNEKKITSSSKKKKQSK